MSQIARITLLLGSLFSGVALAQVPIHIPTYGQSLSLGNDGCDAISTTQTYTNKMLTGIFTGSLTPLIENTGCTSTGTTQEAPASGLGNTITLLSTSQAQQVVVTKNGVGATAYSGLAKGTIPYTNLITAVTTVHGLLNTSYVPAVMFTHGEADWSHPAGSGGGTTGPQYASDLVQLQSDINTDIRGVTSQSSPVTLFIDQMNSWGAIQPYGGPCFSGDSSYTCATYSTDLIGTVTDVGVPIGQWQAFRDNPKTICLVGPKYQYTYGSSGYHLINTSYLMLGELQGKIIKQVILDGQSCKPLAPRSITVSGTMALVRFWIPVGSLAFDTTLVDGRSNQGFFYHDGSGNTISNVSISGDTVTLALSGTAGNTPYVGYGFSEGSRFVSSGAPIAQANGGNLRDSDPTLGSAGDHLYNWAIEFYEPSGFIFDPYTVTGSSKSGPISISGPISQ